MTRIVGVHGIGNHYEGIPASQAAAVLSQAWTEALASRLGQVRLDVSVAYYAHLLNGAVEQGGDRLDVAGEMARAWAQALGAPDEAAQGWLTYPAHQFAEWIARHFGLDLAMVRWFVGTFLGEVGSYLDGDEPLRTKAQQAVIEAIERHEPAVVIAHSLGSVVAYEALHRRPDLKVGLLITVGSPLGMPDVVFHRLRPDPAEQSRPPGVSRWINVADVGDLVAVPHPLPPCFGVDTDLKDTIAAFDFHRVARYLASRTVSAMVAVA